MAAGNLRQRVQIQQPTQGTDANTGQAVQTWATVATYWAAVTATGGQQVQGQKQQQAQTDYQVEFRQTEITRSIDATYRLIWKGKTLQVKSSVPVEQTGQLVQATERT